MKATFWSSYNKMRADPSYGHNNQQFENSLTGLLFIVFRWSFGAYQVSNIFELLQ